MNQQGWLVNALIGQWSYHIPSKSIVVDSKWFIWGILTRWKAHHHGQVRRKNLPEAGPSTFCSATGHPLWRQRRTVRAAAWRRRPSTILRCWSVWWRCGQKRDGLCFPKWWSNGFQDFFQNWKTDEERENSKMFIVFYDCYIYIYIILGGIGSNVEWRFRIK